MTCPLHRKLSEVDCSRGYWCINGHYETVGYYHAVADLEQIDFNVPLVNSLSILNAINKLLFPVKQDGSTEETVNVH